MAPQRRKRKSTVDLRPDKGECDECGEYCHRDLRRHKLSHLEEAERPFPCPFDFCERRFNQKPNLDVHVNKWHTGTRPYICPHFWKDEWDIVSPCAARFDDPASLSRHRKRRHGHDKNDKDQVYDIRFLKRARQDKDRRKYEVELPAEAVRRVTERWRGVPGGTDALVLPFQDGGVGAAVQDAAESSSASTSNLAPASSTASGTLLSPSPTPAPPHASSPSSSGPSQGSSSSGFSQVSGPSSQSSVYSALGSPAVTSGSSSRTSSGRSSRASSRPWFLDVPGAAGMDQPAPLNVGMSSRNDLFSGAPYAISPVGTPRTYRNRALQYPRRMAPYPPIQRQNAYSRPNASLYGQVPPQYPAMPQYNLSLAMPQYDLPLAMPQYNPYPAAPAAPSGMGWNLPGTSSTPFPDPTFGSGMGVDVRMGIGMGMGMGANAGTNMGMGVNAGTNMGMGLNVPDMFPPFDFGTGMPQVPLAGQPQHQPYFPAGSQGWDMPGYSRGSSPTDSSSSSMPSSPQMRRRYGSDVQDAFEFRYRQ